MNKTADESVPNQQASSVEMWQVVIISVLAVSVWLGTFVIGYTIDYVFCLQQNQKRLEEQLKNPNKPRDASEIIYIFQDF